MADLFSVTAPLAVRFPDGARDILAERLPWRDGLVYLPPFWNLLPVSEALRHLPGPVRGDGPWKLGPATVTVLGCRGSDPELAATWAQWQAWLDEQPDYPDPETLTRIMREHAGRRFG